MTDVILKLAGWLLALLALAGAPPAAARDPASLVDPFIGTGGYGHTFPGATVPFGMVQLSPDTRTARFGKDSYKWAAGYQYGDDSILGFSHTHFSGTGHSDLGDVLVMPVSGEARLDPGDPARPGSGYRSRIDKATETASPGYYAVTLTDYGVRAELTATERVGVHRYRFAKGGPAHLLIDLRHSIYDYEGKVLWSRLRMQARRGGHRLSRDPRLGAGPAALLRHAGVAAGRRATPSSTGRRRSSTRASARPAGTATTSPSARAAHWSACSTSAR